MVAYVGHRYLTSDPLGELKTGAMVPTPATGSGTLEQFKAKAAVFWTESGLRGQGLRIKGS